MKTMLINFTEGDMQKVALDEPVKPDAKMPEEPTKPEFNLYVNDKDKGQWYVKKLQIKLNQLQILIKQQFMVLMKTKRIHLLKTIKLLKMNF